MLLKCVIDFEHVLVGNDGSGKNEDSEASAEGSEEQARIAIRLEPGGGLRLTYIEEVDINGIVNDTISGI